MSKKRTRTTPSEESKMLKEYRHACSHHVVTFETDLSENDIRKGLSSSDDLRIEGNECTAKMNNRLQQARRTKAFRQAKKNYGYHKDKMKSLDKDSAEYKSHETEKTRSANILNDIYKQYGVTFADLREMLAKLGEEKDINSVFCLTRAEDIWQGYEKVLYSDGKRVSFKKRGDLPPLRAKQANRAIVIKVDKNGELVFKVGGIGEFGIKSIIGDIFLEEEYQAIINFMTGNPVEEEKACAELYKNTGHKILNQVFRPCYATLMLKNIRGKNRAFIQITIASPALPKKNRDGSSRHVYGTGRIGADIGTQSCAVVSKDAVELFNLAERNNVCTKKYENRMKFLQRKMESSKRVNNPERFNADGTYKKGIKGKWKKTKHYRKMEYELRELHRKSADSRKFAIREDANHLRSLGNVIITESGNARKLQKKSKNVERQEQTSIITDKRGNRKEVHKFKKRKRFGRSVLHRCPGQFQAEIKRKFGDGYHEVPMMYRASQYDHELDEYIKKKLQQRFHKLPSGKKIQRDLYSGFLLYCANNSITCIDRDRCFKEFDSFFEKHQATIDFIIKNNINICNSGIKTA